MIPNCPADENQWRNSKTIIPWECVRLGFDDEVQ